MKNMFRTHITFQHSLIISSHLYNTNAFTIDDDEIILIVSIESNDFRLPQLEVLQLEYRKYIIFIWYIEHLKRVCIHVDGLVTDNEFFEFGLIRTSVNSNVCITDWKFVLEFQREDEFIWVAFIKSNQKQTKLFFVFIGKEIEAGIFLIVYHFFNVTDIEFCIKVNRWLMNAIIVNTVIWRSNDEVGLSRVGQEELRLPSEWCLKGKYVFYWFSHIVQLENLISICEYKNVPLIIFEFELHCKLF